MGKSIERCCILSSESPFLFPVHLKPQNNYNDTTEYTMYNTELVTTPQGIYKAVQQFLAALQLNWY